MPSFSAEGPGPALKLSVLRDTCKGEDSTKQMVKVIKTCSRYKAGIKGNRPHMKAVLKFST